MGLGATFPWKDWFNLMSIAACAGDAIQSQAAFEQLEGLFAKSEEDPAATNDTPTRIPSPEVPREQNPYL